MWLIMKHSMRFYRTIQIWWPTYKRMRLQRLRCHVRKFLRHFSCFMRETLFAYLQGKILWYIGWYNGEMQWQVGIEWKMCIKVHKGFLRSSFEPKNGINYYHVFRSFIIIIQSILSLRDHQPSFSKLCYKSVQYGWRL